MKAIRGMSSEKGTHWCAVQVLTLADSVDFATHPQGVVDNLYSLLPRLARSIYQQERLPQH
jgi:hypothetical protein